MTRLLMSLPLCGGLKAPLEKAGINTRIEAHRVLDALRDDVAWLAGAMSPEQKAAIGEACPDLVKDATWADTEEGRQARRVEVDRQRESYTRHRGEAPPW